MNGKEWNLMVLTFIVHILAIGNDSDLYADLSIVAAQAEAGSYPTSYIPTQGGVGTRVDESCSGAGNDQVINSTEGVLFWKGTPKQTSTYRYLSLSDGISNNFIQIRFNSDNSISNRMMSDGLNQGSTILTSSYDISNEVAIAVRWYNATFSMYINGDLIATTQTGLTMPSNLSDLSFDSVSAAKFYVSTEILQVYNTALTDQELINLTTI